jgi:hypothetical protein
MKMEFGRRKEINVVHRNFQEYTGIILAFP